MAEGGAIGNCNQSTLPPATSGEIAGNNRELNKNNKQNELNTDSSDSCFLNSSSAVAITTNNVNNANLFLLCNSNSSSCNNNNNTANNIENDNDDVDDDDDDDDDDESNQTFYEAAGEPELVLTFEKSLKISNNDVTTSLPPPLAKHQFVDDSNAQSMNNVEKQPQQQEQQQQLNKNFLSVQMEKNVDGMKEIVDVDEECEGAVGIVSTITDALKEDANEKELNLLYTKQDDFIKVEEDEPVVMRRRRDKSKRL